MHQNVDEEEEEEEEHGKEKEEEKKTEINVICSWLLHILHQETTNKNTFSWFRSSERIRQNTV